MSEPKFKAGDRILHKGMQEYGFVESVADGVVDVKYDRQSERGRKEHWRGKYDARWFELHPGWLIKVED